MEVTSLLQKKKAIETADNHANGKTIFAVLLKTTIRTMVSAIGKNASNAIISTVAKLQLLQLFCNSFQDLNFVAPGHANLRDTKWRLFRIELKT